MTMTISNEVVNHSVDPATVADFYAGKAPWANAPPHRVTPRIANMARQTGYRRALQQMKPRNPGSSRTCGNWRGLARRGTMTPCDSLTAGPSTTSVPSLQRRRENSVKGQQRQNTAEQTRAFGRRAARPRLRCPLLPSCTAVPDTLFRPVPALVAGPSPAGLQDSRPAEALDGPAGQASSLARPLAALAACWVRGPHPAVFRRLIARRWRDGSDRETPWAGQRPPRGAPRRPHPVPAWRGRLRRCSTT